MSKRDMRAKKLLLAVLLAMSMQSYYAAPTWAVESGQPAEQTETVDGKGQSGSTTTPAADEAETSAPAEGEEAAAEGEDSANTDAAVSPVTYGVRAASAGTDEYGVMPAVVAPGGNPSTNAYTAGDASVSGSNLAVAIGYGANATSADFSVVLGASGEATAKNAVALGYNAKANHENSVAIGANSTTTAANQVSFGKFEGFDEYNLPVWAVARSLVGIKDIDINGINFEGDIHDENVIIGGYMDVPSKYSVMLGSGAVVYADYSVAIGNNAKVVYENSVAIGANSLAEAEYVVSFGNNDTSEFRTLVNVRGIEFAEENGYIFGMTNINGVEVAYKNNPSEGLKFGGNAIVGKENIPFSSTGFSVSDNGAITATSFTDGKATLTGGKLTGVAGINSTGAITTASLSSTGAITAASGTIGGITLNGGKLDKITSINGANFTTDNNSIAVGALAIAEDSGSAFGLNSQAKGYNSVAIGNTAKAKDSGSIAIGSISIAEGANSIAIGIDNLAEKEGSIAIGTSSYAENIGSIALGSHAEAPHENSVAIGSKSFTTADNQVAFGTGAVNADKTVTWTNRRSLAGIEDIDMAGTLYINGIEFKGDRSKGNVSITGENTDGTQSVAVGFGSEAWHEGSTALGYGAAAYNANSVAIGKDAKAYIDAEYSIAIGANSVVENQYEVSFGDAENDLYRDLVNVDDIYMHGAIIGVNNINGLAVSGNASTGFTVGDNATIGKPDTPFSSKDFSVSNTGAITAASGTIGGVTFSGGALDKVSSINGIEFNLSPSDENIFIGNGIGGHNNKKYSIIIGDNCYVDGSNSVAIGNMACGSEYTVAVGVETSAATNYSTVIGGMAYADGKQAISLGHCATAQGDNSVAIGTGSYAGQSSNNEVNIGYYKLDDKGVTIETTYYGRSLAGISSIDFIAGEDGTKGVITGVTSINGMNFVYDEDNSNIILGANVDKDVANTIALGVGATASGPISMALGNSAWATAQEAIAIGADASVFGEESVGIGSSSTNSAGQTVVIGVNACVDETAYTNSTVIGYSSRSSAKNGIALGANAEVKHENSVAIGTESITTAVNQVSFGHKKDDLNAGGGFFGDDLFRSVVNVADIEMHGGITGLTSINNVAVSGSAAAGLTVSGVTLNGGAVNGVTLGLKGGDTDKEHVLVGGVDLTALSQNSGGNTGDITALKTKTEGIERTGDGSSTPYATTIEGVTLSSSKVTASGGIVVDSNNQLDAAGLKASKVNGATITSNTFNEVLLEKDAGNSHYKVGDVDVTALSGTVGDTTKGLVKDTAD